VIPIGVRRELGLEPGDRVRYLRAADGHSFVVQRQESIDEVAARLHGYLKPGIEPLTDPRSFYETREPRV
jgi:bifunctional DNA-binding transcriptional regulator/antitoxin component of YhaV-PrlF toxin-antitoxin module